MDLINQLLERRAALKTELEALAAPKDDAGELRALTAEENDAWNAHVTQIKELDERVEELRQAELRESRAAAAHVANGTTQTATAAVVSEPNPVYRKGDPSAPSFFRDMAAVAVNRLDILGPQARSINEARERLAKSQETRAGDMTTVAGAGGEFAPPAWYVADFIAYARGGRVTADLCNKQMLPSGISSVNLPKVSTGTATGVQATQNSALTDTAMTTTSVSSGITTIGGKQIVSLQLLQQSGIAFDNVILQDLAKAYAVNVDTQVLYGSNANGQVRGLVGIGSAQAFTTASPAPASVTNANSLYYAVSKAAATVQTTLFEPANAIVMHPNRWAWVVGSVDANARPFVVPSGPAFNQLGGTGDQVAQGFAGTFGSYNVYTDPNISLTANSATNQDEIYVLRTDELWLYESAVQTASFDATYADNASILFRILGYLAFIPHRYTTGAVVPIRGTGLVAP